MEKKKIKEIDKEKASMILGSYIDTLGFYDSMWEFNYNVEINNLNDAMLVNYEIVHRFMIMGGINIDISTWLASDDTIMQIATMKACKKGAKLVDFIDCYIDILPKLKEKKRVSGITTINSLNILEKYRNINKITYSSTMGGNGAAMRTGYIGIYFKDNIAKIIETSILASRLTHNYPMGFLGGMVTALFTSYAMNDIEPWKWCPMLLELYETKVIDNIIKKMSIYNKYVKDKDDFWNPWYRYKEFRLNKFDLKTSIFLQGYDRYDSLINILYEDKKNISFSHLGGSGAGATIIAYDSILTSIISKKNPVAHLDLKDENSYFYSWESLVFNSTLHFGDNDTTGTIAGCWYGALRGFSEVDKKIINMLEFKSEL